jgi:hypothetical protein
MLHIQQPSSFAGLLLLLHAAHLRLSTMFELQFLCVAVDDMTASTIQKVPFWQA